MPAMQQHTGSSDHESGGSSTQWEFDPGPETPPPTGAGGQGGDSLETLPEDRTLAMIAHLSAFAGFLVPLGNVIGPLVVWLVKKDDAPFVAEHAKEALNFQITVVFVALAMALAVVVTFGLAAILVAPLAGILAIVVVVLTILAAVRAYSGGLYRYPATIRLVK